MKYGVISYDKKVLNLDGRDSQNMGDWTQMIAAEELFKEWGIDEYLKINRNSARTYNGEYAVVLFNCFNSATSYSDYQTDTFPLSPRILPVFWGFHYHNIHMDSRLKNQLLLYQPIGCRDEETMKNLQNQGIPCFLSGCITALIKKRKIDESKADKIIAVDIPEDLKQFIPKEYLGDIEYYSHSFPILRKEGEYYMTSEETKAAYNAERSFMEYYKKNAKLVITSRLHVASPCIAMGIPTILVKHEFDGRYSWIDKYTTLYSRDKWDKINWHPHKVDYENDKEFIKKNLEKKLKSTMDKYGDLYSVSEIFENRKRCLYNSSIKHNISFLKKFGEEFNYVIWGMTRNTTRIYNEIKKMYPNSCLKKVYDKKIIGVFENIRIESPDKMVLNKDWVYIVAATSAEKIAKEILVNNKYIIVDFNKQEWDNNISD